MTNLQAPDGYWELTPEEKAEICNGAGAKGGIKVPNTMYGLDLTEVFNIHDYMYYMGENEDDKRKADRAMLENSMIAINKYGGWLSWFRRRRALKYYEAVVYFGAKAFYAGKGKKPLY